MRHRIEVGESRPDVELRVPIDPINEQVVLAAALVDEEIRKKYTRSIPADSFHVEEHRVAWQTLADMVHQGLSFDPATMHSIAGDRVRVQYIVTLMEERPTVPDNLQWHLERLRWDKQRSVAAAGAVSALIEAMKNQREEPQRVRALARSVGEAFDGYSQRQHVYDPIALVAEQMATIRARENGSVNFPFGINGIDYMPEKPGETVREARLTPGAKPGLVTIITGVPGSGKSVVAATMAIGLANQKRRVTYGAWEVQAPMTIEIMARISLGWLRQEPKGALLTKDQLDQIQAEMTRLAAWVTFFKNPFRRVTGDKRHNEANMDLVQGVLQDNGASVFIADLWARCLASRKPEDEEEALFRQQAMCEEMQVHGVLVHQQRHKDVEQRNDKRPTREGIKGSGAYVEVADTMIGVHRPAMWKRVSDDWIEVFVLKQRFGPWPFGIELEWDGARAKISGGRSIEYDTQGESYAGDMGSRFRAPRGDGTGEPRGGRNGRRS